MVTPVCEDNMNYSLYLVDPYYVKIPQYTCHLRRAGTRVPFEGNVVRLFTQIFFYLVVH